MIEILLFITMVFMGCGVLLYAKINIKNKAVDYIYNFIFSKTFISFILFFIIFWIYEYNNMFFIWGNKNMFFWENEEIIISYCIILFIIFCSYFKFKCLLEIPLFGAFLLIENFTRKEYSMLIFLITLVVINFGYVYFTKTEYKKINIIYNVILIILILFLLKNY